MLRSAEMRSNNIDAIRLILSLLVVFSHSYALATGTYNTEPLYWFSQRGIALGELAVDWFFVLSGYLITQSWERSRDVWSFLRKRVCRIYPGYLVAVATCFWVVIPMASFEGFRVYSWHSFITNVWRVFLLRDLSAPEAFTSNPYPKMVNGSLWTIPFEFYCYLGVVLLGTTTLIRRRWFIAGLFLASLAIGFGFFFFELNTQGRIFGVIFGSPRSWARLLPFFLSGAVAYLFRDRFRWDRRLAFLSLLGVILGFFVPQAMTITLPTLGTYLLLYLAFTTDWEWHDAARYGDFSYGIYLFSYPIQQLFMLRLGRGIHPFHLFSLTLAPSILAGMLSWYLVERHFLKRSNDQSTIKRVLAYSWRNRLARKSEPSALS